MEIKVSSTGKSSRMPDRFIVNLHIRATSKIVNSAKDLQSAKLNRVRTILNKHNVEFKYLSTPSVVELTQREETSEGDGGKKTTKLVVSGYSYFQNAEISVDGWGMDAINLLIGDLSIVCEDLNSRFDLTEAQRAEMSKEALERSYKLAVDNATVMYGLENSRSGLSSFGVQQIRLKEAEIVAKDYGDHEERCYGVAKASSFVSEERTSKQTISVKKPMEVSNTVKYTFEG